MDHTLLSDDTLRQQKLLLYWLREDACESATRVTLADLEPAIQPKVAQLLREGMAARPESEWLIRLPFLDHREWRRREEILQAMPMERVSNLIRSVLDPAGATRDSAATYALTDPAWIAAPKAADAEYFSTWQRVSLALQRELKKEMSALYFAELDRFEDRAMAYMVLAYQASRPFYGRAKTEFTYDLRDYPQCTHTLTQALRLTGRAIQALLADAEARLVDEGRPELSRRYSPVWYEDVLVAAKKRPRQLVELLAAETAVINAVIDLGSDRTAATVNRCARAINGALRNVLGIDMRRLGCGVLDEASRTLAEIGAERGHNAGYLRPLENRDARAAGSPRARVGR